MNGKAHKSTSWTVSLQVPTPHAWSLVLFLVSISLSVSRSIAEGVVHVRVLPDVVNFVKLTDLREESSYRLLIWSSAT